MTATVVERPETSAAIGFANLFSPRLKTSLSTGWKCNPFVLRSDGAGPPSTPRSTWGGRGARLRLIVIRRPKRGSNFPRSTKSATRSSRRALNNSPRWPTLTSATAKRFTPAWRSSTRPAARKSRGCRISHRRAFRLTIGFCKHATAESTRSSPRSTANLPACRSIGVRQRTRPSPGGNRSWRASPACAARRRRSKTKILCAGPSPLPTPCPLIETLPTLRGRAPRSLTCRAGPAERDGPSKLGASRNRRCVGRANRRTRTPGGIQVGLAKFCDRLSVAAVPVWTCPGSSRHGGAR